jgi:phosphoesterase RecJ-like protein
MQHVKQLFPILKEKKIITIVTHYKPDGDAIGSSLGIGRFLRKQGHKVQIIIPSEFPEFLSWMEGAEGIINYEADNASAEAHVKDCEILFCLDFNHPSRTNGLEQAITDSEAIKVLIDHHLDPPGFEDYTLHSSAASSTCELVYDFIEMADGLDTLDKAIAESLYTGIMTDTGSFRFSSVTAKVHFIIAKLIEAGAENAKIHSKISDSFTESRLRIMGHAISEKLTLKKEINAAYMMLTRKEFQKFNVKNGDTEGVVNYPLSIKSIRLSVMISEKEDKISMSFRSKGTFPANLVAAEFGGGGHLNAAGGKGEATLELTEKKLLATLEKFKSQLID